MTWPERAAETLADEHLRLTRLAESDREPLRAIAMDADIWRYFVTRVCTDADFDSLIDSALAEQRAGRRIAYGITDLATGRKVGSMSFCNLHEADGRLEIGWSWLGTAFHGTGLNACAKQQLLAHAFETLGVERVEFRTDVLNLRARQALRNIGAVEEGTLRSFNPMPDGRRRDAIYYSVLRAEWPAVRDRLAGHARRALERAG
jgi:RimJ/RimL family protein N-acetyltransferase